MTLQSFPMLVAYVDKARDESSVEAYAAWSSADSCQIQPIAEILDAASLTTIRKSVDAAVTGEAVIYEAMARFKDWGEKFVRVACVPAYASSGDVRGVFVLLADLSEPKHIQEQLQLSEERYRSLVAAASAVILITSRKGHCETPQSLWEAFTGQPWETYRGLGWLDAVHPDDRQPLIDSWGASLRQRRPYSAEARLWSAAHQDYRHVIVRGTPIRNADGRIREWVGTVTDDHDRKSNELLRARLASIVEESSDAILSKTLDGIVTSWNKGAERIYGYSAEEIVGRSIAAIVPDDKAAEFADVMERLRQGERIEQLETERMCKYGRRIHVSVTISPISDDQGRLVAASIIARDTTEQKMFERALRESEERLRAALAASDTGTFRWEMQSGGLYWDENLYRLFGLHEMQVIQSPEEFIALVHPDDRQAVIDATELSRREGRDFELQFRVIWSDGTIHWLLDKGKVFCDERGEPQYMTGACVDITRRKRAEEALEESEARFRGTFEEAAVGLAHVDRDGRWLQVNHRLCEILGYSKDELAAMTFEDVSHPADRDEDWRQFGALMSGAISSYRLEKRHRRKDHTVVWTQLTASVQRDDAGRPLYAIRVIEDITARKEAEKALQEINETLERRVAERTASLVHYQEQLRGLTSELTITAETERRRLATELHDFLAQQLVVCQLKLSQIKRYTKGSDADVMAKELDNLLSTSLRYTRSLIAELSPTVLYEAGLVPALRWLAEHMKQHNLQVDVQEVADVGKLPEDQAILLFQAIRELLFNVVKHAGVDTASVTVERRGQDLHAAVRDTGKGFQPAEEHDASGGSGRFGLFSIRERMEAMGGGLHVQSRVGDGTECELWLPVRPQDADGAAPEPAASKAKPRRSRKRVRDDQTSVLLAEDHTMVREGLRRVLEEYPDIVVVGEAADGLQAIEAVHILQPDVLLIDVNMPHLNGIDAIHQIRYDFPSLKIIVLSVQDDNETMDRALQAGANAYLTKGGPTEQLYQVIKQLHNQDAGSAGAGL